MTSQRKLENLLKGNCLLLSEVVEIDFEEKLRIIKSIIAETAKKYNIEIIKIILFGSRARGDYTEDSDWDILLVTEKKINREIKRKFLVESRRKIIKATNDPIDIIIIDKNHYEEYKNIYGDIAGIATLEGITI